MKMTATGEQQCAIDSDGELLKKEIIFVFGVLEELKRIGILEGGKFKLNSEGRKTLARLRKEKFHMTAERIRIVTAGILEHERKDKDG